MVTIQATKSSATAEIARLRVAEFGRITLTALTPFTVIQGHRF